MVVVFHSIWDLHSIWTNLTNIQTHCLKSKKRQPKKKRKAKLELSGTISFVLLSVRELKVPPARCPVWEPRYANAVLLWQFCWENIVGVFHMVWFAIHTQVISISGVPGKRGGRRPSEQNSASLNCVFNFFFPKGLISKLGPNFCSGSITNMHIRNIGIVCVYASGRRKITELSRLL